MGLIWSLADRMDWQGPWGANSETGWQAGFLFVQAAPGLNPADQALGGFPRPSNNSNVLIIVGPKRQRRNQQEDGTAIANAGNTLAAIADFSATN